MAQCYFALQLLLECSLDQVSNGQPSHTDDPWSLNPQQWQSGCNILGSSGLVTGSGDSASGELSGTVTVKVSWIGQTAAPNHVWLKVDSSASWSGDSGTCSNGQNDQATSIQPGPGGISAGKHLIRKNYSGQPIQFDIQLSASFDKNTPGAFSDQVALAVEPTNRSASLARSDGGPFTLLDGAYTGHTLLSWSGNHDGVDYDNLPDGGPGPTIQHLNGAVAGTWSQKEFINPQTLQPYTAKDLLVNWSGSTQGAVSFTPPNPLTVDSTQYYGQMPQFDPQGTAPKEETWKYRVKDNQDGSVLDLTWKWIAHYAHENWSPITLGENEQPEYNQIVGPVVWQHYVSPEQPDAYGYAQVSGYLLATTLYTGGTPAGIPGFDVHAMHIGIPDIRTVYGKSQTYPYGNPGVPTSFEVHYDSLDGTGTYSIKPVAKAPLIRGTVTVWNKKGESGVGAMRFASCYDYQVGFEQFGPSGGS